MKQAYNSLIFKVRSNKLLIYGIEVQKND